MLSFKDVYIDPTAVIDDNVIIGTGTKIWHFCHISENAIIGKNCILGQNVYIGPEVMIGNGVKIQNNVSVYTGVEIEDDVFLGPSCVFTNVHKPRSFMDKRGAFSKTTVQRGATIGANATIICGELGRVIGQYSLVGAGSVVLEDVLPYKVVVGNPAREIRNLSGKEI